MKKALRILVLFLVFLVVLTPTYILIGQVAKTVAPTVTVGGTELEPAYVRWRLTRKNDTTVSTSLNLQQSEKNFEAIPLSSIEDLKDLCFDREPNLSQIMLFDLTTGTASPSMSLEEFQAAYLEGGQALFGKTQIVLTLQWNAGDNIRIQAGYSMEVTPQ